LLLEALEGWKNLSYGITFLTHPCAIKTSKQVVSGLCRLMQTMTAKLVGKQVAASHRNNSLMNEFCIAWYAFDLVLTTKFYTTLPFSILPTQCSYIGPLLCHSDLQVCHSQAMIGSFSNSPCAMFLPCPTVCCQKRKLFLETDHLSHIYLLLLCRFYKLFVRGSLQHIRSWEHHFCFWLSKLWGVIMLFTIQSGNLNLFIIAFVGFTLSSLIICISW
jgi:hypothetical protein